MKERLTHSLHAASALFSLFNHLESKTLNNMFMWCTNVNSLYICEKHEQIVSLFDCILWKPISVTEKKGNCNISSQFCFFLYIYIYIYTYMYIYIFFSQKK